MESDRASSPRSAADQKRESVANGGLPASGASQSAFFEPGLAMIALDSPGTANAAWSGRNWMAWGATVSDWSRQ